MQSAEDHYGASQESGVGAVGEKEDAEQQCNEGSNMNEEMAEARLASLRLSNSLGRINSQIKRIDNEIQKRCRLSCKHNVIPHMIGKCIILGEKVQIYEHSGAVLHMPLDTFHRWWTVNHEPEA